MPGTPTRFDPIIAASCERGTDATLLMLLNSHHEPVPFTLPPCNGIRAWRLLIDTAFEQFPEQRELRVGEIFESRDRSLALFELLPGAS